MAPPSAATLVGRWLHDGRGGIIGSVGSVSPGGPMAMIVLGVYKLGNVRVVEALAGARSILDGKPRCVTRPPRR